VHASLRTYSITGVAIIGAGVIAITPVAPAPPAVPAVSADVALTGASVANVPVNLINAVLNVPGAMVAGMERLAVALQASGSWNASSPNNVWGWDPANPEMLQGVIDMTLPFAPLSTSLGEHLNWWAAANLPMHTGCAFECRDLGGMLNSMFRVPMWEFWDSDGYTFGPVINPVNGAPTAWSGQTVKLDPWQPVRSVVDYLLADPGKVRFPTAYEIITAVANLAAALQTTGHLPKWIAVREIETFFKLFVPKPRVTTVALSGAADQPAVPAAAALRALESADEPEQHPEAVATDLKSSAHNDNSDILGTSEPQTPAPAVHAEDVQQDDDPTQPDPGAENTTGSGESATPVADTDVTDTDEATPAAVRDLDDTPEASSAESDGADTPADGKHSRRDGFDTTVQSIADRIASDEPTSTQNQGDGGATGANRSGTDPGDTDSADG
jgi:hypothetical protein